jgi:hypothetical protein
LLRDTLQGSTDPGGRIVARHDHGDAHWRRVSDCPSHFEASNVWKSFSLELVKKISIHEALQSGDEFAEIMLVIASTTRTPRELSA